MNPTLAPVILVIEDDPAIQKVLRVSLEAGGYQVVEARTGQDGVLQAATRSPDVIILDLGLPDMAGEATAREIRQWSSVPILVVSARGKEFDKVAVLDAGVDDYLTKPFSIQELLARLRALLRRRRPVDHAQPAVFQAGDLVLDVAQRRVTLADRPVHLTRHEYRLLCLLMRHAGRVLTHSYLLREIWGPDAAEQTHYIRVYINQLRRKIEADPSRPRHILTEPGVGYRWAESP
jgi:two-component system KDP operon response regulator KdpE